MGSISYTIPAAGSTLNSVADPEIATALQTILTWANGNVDTNNLSPSAAIVRSQLAGGAGNLALVSTGVNTSATDGHLYQCTAGSITITLPTPTINATVGVYAGSAGITGATPVTITASSGNIGGVGLSAASMTLGTLGAAVILQGNGSNWVTVSGQQDTGWVTLTLGTNLVAATGYYVPSGRLVGDTVHLRGGMTSTAITGTTIATLPVGMRPASNAAIPAPATTNGTTWGIGSMQVTTGGLLTNQGYASGTTVIIEGTSFSLN